MVKRQDIRAYVNKLVGRFHPQKVILFGSYAYGKPTEDSDVDLLVVMPYRGHSAMMSAQIRQAIRAGFPMDLVVRSPSELQRRVEIGDGFIAEILDRGRLLYETGNA